MVFTSRRSCAPRNRRHVSPKFWASLERLEATCANAVERAFAAAFPTPLEPVQIARKLVAAFESGVAASGRGGRRFRVRLSAADFGRFEGELPYLHAQWRVMLMRLSERSGRPQRPPEVFAEVDRAVATGTVSIVAEALAEPVRLALRVRRGMPPGAAVTLEGRIVVGRDAGCDLVLADPRVSRRHLRIAADLRFADLGSANGTLHNGARVSAGTLGLGDVLVLGDSELVVAGTS